MVEVSEPLRAAPPKLVIDARADRHLVLETLLMGLDLCSPARPMGRRCGASWRARTRRPR